MSQFVFANNVNTTLAAPISSGATSLTLSSTANLPTLGPGQIMELTLNDAATQSVFEIMYVTAIVGAVCTVTRGQEGTAAQAWAALDFAYSSVTKGVLSALASTGVLNGNGYVELGNGLILQWGTKTNVKADGTGAAVVTFPIPFPNSCFGVLPSKLNAYQSNSWGTGIDWDSPTTAGFNVNVFGAPSGISATVSVFWAAIGN